MSRIKKLKLICPECDGSGYSSYRDDGLTSIQGCTECGGFGTEYDKKPKMEKGKGYIYKKFQISSKTCTHCSGSGQLDWQSVEQGTGFFGEYKKTKRFKKDCHSCLGTGKELFEIFITKCPNCEGMGKNSYWKKGFFGTEYKKYKTCKTCSGNKFIEEKASYVFNS